MRERADTQVKYICVAISNFSGDTLYLPSVLLKWIVYIVAIEKHCVMCAPVMEYVVEKDLY